MIEKPEIAQTEPQATAHIHLTVPREQIQQVMGPGYEEVMAAVKARGMEPTGPWFTHHLKMDPKVFDFEICVPVPSPIQATGRVQPGRTAAEKVVRTVYHGPYEGLADAWGEVEAWIAEEGLKTAPDLWELYAVGPVSGPDPDGWRTVLSRPLAN